MFLKQLNSVKKVIEELILNPNKKEIRVIASIDGLTWHKGNLISVEFELEQKTDYHFNVKVDCDNSESWFKYISNVPD